MKTIRLALCALCFQAIVKPQPVRAEEASVTVHLLDHTGEKKTATRFWIDWLKVWRSVVTTKKVTGSDADALVKQLRKSLLNTECLNACGHDPIYGIEAAASDGKQLKTSLCFKCLTWVQPGRRLDIAGSTGIENELCLALRKVIELPKELVEQGAEKK